MGTEVLPAWDAFLLAVPVLAAFAVWIFGLDERLMSPKPALRRSRRFCEVDANGRGVLSDPDGRLWQTEPNRHRPIRRIEARMVRTGGSDNLESLPGDFAC